MPARVLIAKPGLDGHDRGAKLVAFALRDAGFEVIYTGIRQRPSEIVSAAVQENVDLVGLSILSGAHLGLTKKVVEGLRDADAEHMHVVVGGTIPVGDIPKLIDIGASAVFPNGTSIEEFVARLRELTAVGANGDTASSDGQSAVVQPAIGLSAEPTADGFYKLAVERVVEETRDARSFVLAIPDALREKFSYTAGQFCSFRLEVDGRPLVRCYSMSSSPETDDEFMVTVKRVPGGKVSNWMNDRVEVGDVLEVVPPSGRFCLQVDEARRTQPIVAFCGGSGITPVISLVKTALRTTERPITLFYANRDPESVIFRTEIEALVHAAPDRLRVVHWFDVDRGFATAADVRELVPSEPAADFYICGPGPFMDVVEGALDDAGVEKDRVFIERFNLAPVDTVERHAPAESTLDEAVPELVTIVLKGRKKTVPYTAGDTILETARRAKITTPFSCQQGDCGTCMGQTTKGMARMRSNNVLTPEEVGQGLILTCQAVPVTEAFAVEYF